MMIKQMVSKNLRLATEEGTTIDSHLGGETGVAHLTLTTQDAATTQEIHAAVEAAGIVGTRTMIGERLHLLITIQTISSLRRKL